jgi:hypothetical protein
MPYPETAWERAMRQVFARDSATDGSRGRGKDTRLQDIELPPLGEVEFPHIKGRWQ